MSIRGDGSEALQSVDLLTSQPDALSFLVLSQFQRLHRLRRWRLRHSCESRNLSPCG